MIKIICNRCNKPIESIQKVGFIQFCYQNPFESVTDNNMSDRNHYCEDCMAEIERFVRNDGGKVVNKIENMEKALSDALQEVHEMSTEKSKQKKSEEPKKAKWVDTGKILALWNAKWSIGKIAEEMGMEESEVANILTR